VIQIGFKNFVPLPVNLLRMQYNIEQSFVNSLPIGAAIFKGIEHTIQVANQQMLAIWGKDTLVIGQNLHDAIPEIKDQNFFKALTEIYNSGEPFHDPDGKAMLMVNGKVQPVYFDYWLTPIKDDTGKVIGVMNTAINTSEKVREQQVSKEASENLRAVNQRLQITVEELGISNNDLQTAVEQLSAAREAAQLGLFDWDLINHTYKWDARFKQMFGLGAENNPDHYYVMVSRLHEDDRERVKKAVLDARNWENTKGKYDVEYRIVGAGDVPVRWARALGRVIFDEHGNPVRFIGTLMDITDQVLIRQQLILSEEQLSMAIESADLGTWFIDTDTMQITPSTRVKEMFGFDADEHMPLSSAIDQIAEEYRDGVAKAINSAIENGKSYDIQYPVIGFHDNKLRWVRATGKLYPGSNGQKPIFSGTIADISEQKQNEQRKNDFISMVSHELKTPLTSTLGYIQISQKRAVTSEDSVSIKMLDRSIKQLGKMTSLINGFLNVAQLEGGKIHIEKELFDMAAVLKEVEEVLLLEHTPRQIIFDLVEQTWVYADKDKIEQVLNNFISNALKYSAPGTTVQIACIRKGDHVYVSVKDSGLGIKAEDQEKLFDRFFRVESKETQSIAGFGIGLYICKEIIDRHHGKIGVDSALHQGSTFWFSLPLSKTS
jgi:two-component system sensor histidine kinase VicK